MSQIHDVDVLSIQNEVAEFATFDESDMFYSILEALGMPGMSSWVEMSNSEGVDIFSYKTKIVSFGYLAK